MRCVVPDLAVVVEEEIGQLVEKGERVGVREVPLGGFFEVDRVGRVRGMRNI